MVQAKAIDGGVITICVKDMDRSVRFYTEALGLELAYRAGDHWAQIDAGKGLSLGIHPAMEGQELGCGMQVGFNVTGTMEEAMRELESRGVGFPSGIHEDSNGNVRLAFFKDPDGHEHYLCQHVR